MSLWCDTLFIQKIFLDNEIKSYVFIFKISHKNEEHSYKDATTNFHNKFFYECSRSKISIVLLKFQTKILIYYICFISKIYVKIFWTNYLVSLVS